MPVSPAPGRAAAPHPFAAVAKVLAEVLGGTATRAAPGTAALSLPTRSAAPVDSPELLRDSLPEHARGAITLRTWLVPTLEFEADDALAALSEIEPDPMVVGATVRHLADVAGFAHDLVVRGRILPSLVSTPDGPQAVWRPVLTGADALWAQALTLALPPAGRAGGTTGPPPAGGCQGRDVVAQAIDGLVDAAARTALPPPHLPRRRPRNVPALAAPGARRSRPGEPGWPP